MTNAATEMQRARAAMGAIDVTPERDPRAYGGDQGLKGRIDLTLNIGLDNNPCRSMLEDGGADPACVMQRPAADGSTRRAIAKAFFEALQSPMARECGVDIWHDCHTFIRIVRPGEVEGVLIEEPTAILTARLSVRKMPAMALEAIVYALALATKQQAIAYRAVTDLGGQYVETERLTGPDAALWGSFDAGRFAPLNPADIADASEAFAIAKTDHGKRATYIAA